MTPVPPNWRRLALVLVLAALALLAIGWTLRPDALGMPTLGGDRLGGSCPYLAQTGQDCPNCGTTRAVMWAARGNWWTAAQYHPAATYLLAWLYVAAGVSLVRLVRDRPRWLQPPWHTLVVGAFVGMLLYAGVGVARMQGWLRVPVVQGSPP